MRAESPAGPAGGVMSKQTGPASVELYRLLAGEQHAPVVYFARIGDNVKIGTTTNLKSRMRSFYLSLDDVLAIVPGGEDVEDTYHERFAWSRIRDDDRRELFRLDAQLSAFLGLTRYRRKGDPRFRLPQHEVGNVPDLEDELRALTHGGGPWDLEKAEDLVARLTCLGVDGDRRDDALIRDVLKARNEAWRPQPRLYPRWWFLTAAGWRQRAWEKRLAVRWDRAVIVRDLFTEAQERWAA
jgi:hypothetical protein